MNRVKLILEPRGEDGVVKREVLNSPLEQGTGETVKYYVDFADWGASESNPCTSPTVTVLLNRDESDVTTTIHAADDATVVSNTEVEFTLAAFSRYKTYTVYVKATSNSLIEECYVQIRGTK